MSDRMTAAEYRQTVRDAWSEQEFTDAVIALFREHGWLVAHFRPARTDKGWRTAMQGDAGFPDIVAAKEDAPGFYRSVTAELKVGRGRLSPGQEAWCRALGAFVWKPRDWATIERIARGE